MRGAARHAPASAHIDAVNGLPLLNPKPTTEVEAHPALLEREDYTLVAWYRYLLRTSHGRGV